MRDFSLILATVGRTTELNRLFDSLLVQTFHDFEVIIKLFSSLFGLEVSPRLTREAKTFWNKVLELTDIESRDRMWGGFLPTAEDLSTPEIFIASTTIPDDLSNL